MWETPLSTISMFSTGDGSVNGYIMERGGPSTKTANQGQRIPAGTYELVRHASSIAHAKYELLNDDLLMSRHILIHSGNSWFNSDGCLIPGFSTSDGKVWSSGAATDALNNYIDSFNGNVKVNIYDPIKPANLNN